MAYFLNQGQSQDYQAAKTSVKVHHKPGGFSNFSLAHEENQNADNDRFTRTGALMNAPFGSQVPLQKSFHQKTAVKNQSQIDFSMNEQNNLNQAQASNGFKKGLWNVSQNNNAYEEEEDSRYPRKKQFQDSYDNDQYRQQGKSNYQKQNQNIYGRDDEADEEKIVPGSFKDRYLKERKEKEGFQQNQNSYSKNQYLDQQQPKPSNQKYSNDKKQQSYQEYDENAWQKPKKSKKALCEQNQFVTQQAPFGTDYDFQQEIQQNQNRPQQAQQERPYAGPGSFTSVKYSGNPPGGKSSITF